MDRIVLATDSLEPSGLGEHMLTLGAALRGEFDVTLALFDGEAGAPLLRRAAASGLRIKTIEPGNLATVRQWFASSGADLVHVHAGIGWEGHGLVRAAKGAGLPVVRSEHLPYLLTSIVQQAEYRAMIRSVDRRIAVSQAVADTHAGRGGGRLHVVPNGIQPRGSTRDRAETRAEFGFGASDPLVLTVARLTAQKGHLDLVAAAEAVVAVHPTARFILVGSGPEEASIGEAIGAAGLDRNMLLLGTRDDVPELLASADLFVLPSHFEGLPLALLEAMEAGIPVVATGIEATLEALGADHPALVPPGEPQALAAAINRCLDDPGSCGTVASDMQSRFKRHFTADRMAAETAAIYRSLLPRHELQGTRA